jgi:hypothetical protein
VPGHAPSAHARKGINLSYSRFSEGQIVRQKTDESWYLDEYIEENYKHFPAGTLWRVEDPDNMDIRTLAGDELALGCPYEHFESLTW